MYPGYNSYKPIEILMENISLQMKYVHQNNSYEIQWTAGILTNFSEVCWQCPVLEENGT